MTANQLKEYRRGLGLTQAQLARELCVTRRALISWEVGARSMPLCVEKLFCLLYGINFVMPVDGITMADDHPDLFEGDIL